MFVVGGIAGLVVGRDHLDPGETHERHVLRAADARHRGGLPRLRAAGRLAGRRGAGLASPAPAASSPRTSASPSPASAWATSRPSSCCWRRSPSTALVNGQRLGLLLRASHRDDEAVAESIGIDYQRARLVVFLISSAGLGVIGGFYAGYFRSASLSLFSIDWLLLLFAMIVIGGIGRAEGAVVGTLVVTYIYLLVHRPEAHPRHRPADARGRALHPRRPVRAAASSSARCATSARRSASRETLDADTGRSSRSRPPRSPTSRRSTTGASRSRSASTCAR